MEKEKIMMRLSMDLETFQAHLKRLNRDGYNIHHLDLELLQKKTRDIYDQLFELENMLAPKAPTPVSKPDTTVQHKPVEEPPLQEAAESKTKPEEKVTVEEPRISEAAKEPVITEKPPEQPLSKEISEVPEKVSPAVEEPVQRPPESKPAEVSVEPEETTVPVHEAVEEPKSTIDLFSATAEATVSDKFTGQEETSLAEKIQQQRYTDLRREIGINEKFLFINELFNGDMGRYNKAVDELNELKTQDGINAYLIELKVSNQWQDQNEAYLKLKQLLNRKLN